MTNPVRALPEQTSTHMRNLYQRPPFYRRHWFLGLLIVLAAVACLGAIVAYSLHVHWLDKAASYDMNALGKMESASTIFDRNKVTFGYIFEQKREPVILKQMATDLQHAVVSAEDNRFYTHSGSDFRGIVRASLKNLRSNRVRQGASTITQQLARNTFPLKGRTFGRKILEIYVARRIETTLTKEQILEYYLNRIYLGSGLYGVEAASKGYFGKSAHDLSLGESAMLAGIIKSPNNLSPWQHREAAQSARDFVLGRMVDEGYISRDQYQAAAGEELVVKPRVLTSSDSYAMEAIRQQVVAQVGLDRAVSQGLKIYTTIDARVQKAAEDALHEQLDEIEKRPAYQNHQTYAQYSERFSEETKRAAAAAVAAQDANAAPASARVVMPAPEYLQGALMVTGNADGATLAVVGGRDFKHSEFNRATNSQSRRPAGTAFVPLVYAEAYQKGMFPGRLVLDQVMDNRQVMVGGQSGILGEWGVERTGNHYDGPIPAGVALLEGKNAATVRVGNEVGLKDVLQIAKRAGIASPLREFPATFLGSSEITLSELALAYTGFPNGGWRPAAPFLLAKIEDADGEVLFQAKPRPRVRVIDAAPAYQVHATLAENLRVGIPSRHGLKPMSGGGKSGTAYNFTDAWFAGYNSRATCVVWTGFDKPQSIYRGAFGSLCALPVWVKVMNAVQEFLPGEEIKMPPNLKKVEVCRSSGELATDKCYENVDGERKRTTFVTYATLPEMPKRSCAVHNGGRTALGVIAFNRTQVPPEVASGIPGATPGPKRAVAAVDLTNVKPVGIKAPTVVADASEKDPYETVQPVISPDAAADLAAAANGGANPAGPGNRPVGTPAPEREVRAAQPVQAAAPAEMTNAMPVRIDPPETLQFN